MKIVITGEGSYIGTSFQHWMSQFEATHQIETLNVKGDEWKNHSFSGVDAILHVAGIAHIKETAENASLYYQVNRDLTIALAQKAKKEGVKHFVFLSTMSVYGKELGEIVHDTPCLPKNAYGKSKLEAEAYLHTLEDHDFALTVLRPPMVYGLQCKGNFALLDKLTNRSPLFPKVRNQRSMIHIDLLCECMRQIIIHRISGTYCPQNKDYVCTSDMIAKMAEYKGKHLVLLPGFASIVGLMTDKIGVVGKVFGDLTYEPSLSEIGYDYQVYDFEETIKRSVQP